MAVPFSVWLDSWRLILPVVFSGAGNFVVDGRQAWTTTQQHNLFTGGQVQFLFDQPSHHRILNHSHCSSWVRTRGTAKSTGALFQRMTILPLESIAGGQGCLAIVVFPDLVVERFAGRAAQRAFPHNVPLVIAIQFKEARLLVPVEPIRQYHQNVSFRGLQLGQSVPNPARRRQPSP